MKNLITLISLLVLTSVATAQVQKTFYVDDVETIEYVTVEFCVNAEGRINQVTVIPEETTYNNQYTIKQLQGYLKTVEYGQNSSLSNNCYPSTFDFVSNKYLNASIPESESHKCHKFKTGKYEYADFRYKDVKISRTKSKQIENGKTFKAKYKVTWPSPCEYNMTYYWVREKENKPLLGKTINVKIIGILENSYIYSAQMENKPQFIGEIKKL